MRRPNICGSSASIVDETYKPAASRQNKETTGGGSGRVSLMRRILGGGSSSAAKKKDQLQQSQFGVAPTELALVRTSLFPTPKPLYRMCSYLQKYGVESGSSLFKGMSGGEGLERLKAEWNSTGDARLEDCTSPALVASLLRIWLNELPEPFINKSNTQHLIRVNRKYQGEDSIEWSRAIAEVLSSCCHEVVLGCLDAVLGLLSRYTQAYPLTMAYIPGVFTPLLAHVDDNSSRQDTVDFVSKLILNYNSIFSHMGVDTKEVEEEDRNSLKEAALVISEIAHTARQRKRKERHDSVGQSNNNEPKFVRSNSEERGVVKSCVEDMKTDSMRRVSSHEDFSKNRTHSRVENHHHADAMSLQEAEIIKAQKHLQITPSSQVRKLVQPLHERNARSPDHHHCLMFTHLGEAIPTKVSNPTYANQAYNIAPSQVYAPVGAGYANDLYDENEHEMRRSSERFAPAHTVRTRRHRRPKHRTQQRSNPKENGGIKDRKGDNQKEIKYENEEMGSRGSTPESLLEQDLKKIDESWDRDNSNKGTSDEGSKGSEGSADEDCSSSDEVLEDGSSQDFQLLIQNESYIMREDSLPLDESLPLLDIDGDSTTPVTSSSEQSLKLDENQDEGDTCESSMLGFSSPMLDMKARGEEMSSSEPISSTPLWASLPPPNDERLVSPRNSMVVSRRLYTAGPNPPSDQCVTILDLNAQIHSLKQKLKKYEEGFEREFGFKPSHTDKTANSDIRKILSMLSKLRKQARYKKEEARIANLEKSNSPAPVLSEETVIEIERRLSEKRVSAERGDALDNMSLEQLIEEKGAMQKALLQLEATYGRPSSKKDRDVVRPLYERYRLLKRSLLKQTPSKMKESVSELGTILEHEAMDFSSGGNLPPSPPPSPPPQEEEESICTTPIPPRKTIAQTVVLDNLHSLPPDELLSLQRSTREEKKRLKRSLRQAELEIGARGVRRSDRAPPTDPKLYTDYKHVKAKLKFIDALINKIK